METSSVIPCHLWISYSCKLTDERNRNNSFKKIGILLTVCKSNSRDSVYNYMNQKMSTESWMLKAFEYESFSFIWNMYLQNISDSSKHTAFSFSERLVQRLSLSVDIKLGTCLPLVGNIIKRLAEKSEGFQQNLVKIFWSVNTKVR